MQDAGFKMQDARSEDERVAPMSTGFRGLRVYASAHDLAVRIHKMTLALPRFEMFEEGSQIRRSSKRVSASIVEGYALRHYKAEYLHYLHRAHGSAEETLEHLDFLWDTRSLTDEKLYRDLRAGYLEVNPQLYTFLQGVQRQHIAPDTVGDGVAEYVPSPETDLPS